MKPLSTTLRIVFEETYLALQKNKYTSSSGQDIILDLQLMQQNTRRYTLEILQKEFEQKKKSLSIYPPCIFSVINQDTTVAAEELIVMGHNPLCLNMANANFPGGGVKAGCSAQEEELCRKTGLYFSLDPKENPTLQKQLGPNAEYSIPAMGCIYSPHVPLIRTRHSDGTFSWRDDPLSLSFVSSAALNFNSLKNPPGNYEEITKSKIEAQILTAIIHCHDSMVLSAFGCGVFQNNPNVISRIYQQIFQKYQCYFHHIRFAILTVRERDQQNFDVFFKRFCHSS